MELSAENDLDAKVFMMTRRQVVTVGMSGQIVDISIPAVKIAMDIYGVKDQLSCLNRVRKLFHHFLKAEASDES